MSEPLHGVVVAHGALAPALVGETERISGRTGVLQAVSNSDCGREEIEQRVADAVGNGPAVNLPMLLDFVNQQALPPAESAGRAAGKGADAIRQG